ncbi:MAG: hypothetical protein Q8P38_10070 [Candidatus Nanopelagicales bacterium]|nr:hypothetical protein [Candidatus Nanopelagicales bacterium]
MTTAFGYRVAVAAAGGALLLAGCSSTSTPSPSPSSTVDAKQSEALVEQAAAKTGGLSAKFAGTVTTTRRDEAPSTSTTKGAFDLSTGSLKATIGISLMGEDLKLKLIEIGKTAYFRADALSGILGQKWIKADLSTFGISDPVNPKAALSALKKAANFQDEGTETVNGVEATKYVGTLTYKQAEKLAGTKAAKGRKGSAQLSVWVDSQGRVVKAASWSQSTGPGGPQRVESVLTLSDFDNVGAIKAPPAKKVIDLSQLVDIDALKKSLNLQAIQGQLGGLSLADLMNTKLPGGMTIGDITKSGGIQKLEDSLPELVQLKDLEKSLDRQLPGGLSIERLTKLFK